jgi:hypothetical protein
MLAQHACNAWISSEGAVYTLNHQHLTTWQQAEHLCRHDDLEQTLCFLTAGLLLFLLNTSLAPCISRFPHLLMCCYMTSGAASAGVLSE